MWRVSTLPKDKTILIQVLRSLWEDENWWTWFNTQSLRLRVNNEYMHAPAKELWCSLIIGKVLTMMLTDHCSNYRIDRIVKLPSREVYHDKPKVSISDISLLRWNKNRLWNKITLTISWQHSAHYTITYTYFLPLWTKRSLNIQGVTRVSANTARGGSTSYSKQKTFYKHMHFEHLFNCGVKFECDRMTDAMAGLSGCFIL